MLNCKTITYTNKGKMNIIYEDLLENFFKTLKASSFKGRNQTKTDIQLFQNIITSETFQSYVLALFSVFSNF